MSKIERNSKKVLNIRSVLLVCSILGSLLLFASHIDAQIKAKLDVRIPMRDGVELSADIWMPTAEGKYPVIILRTPYMKTTYNKFMKTFVPEGYVYIVQDTKGRGDSDGEFAFFSNEGEDGYDTIEWAAAQPWSNGKVGMTGVSYLGTSQWLAARERPPHLVCIIPTAPAGVWFNEVPYQGGAFGMGWALWWINLTSGRIDQSASVQFIDLDKIYWHRPLISMDELFGRPMKMYKRFLEHSTFDDYWARISYSPEDFKKIDIPFLTVCGWFDGDQMGTLSYWGGMKAHNPKVTDRYLIIGPWTHRQTFRKGELKFNEMEFSGNSVLDMQKINLDFFNRYLKGEPASFQYPRAKIYITGSNEWKEFEEYPPPSIEYKSFYFHSQGKANTLSGDGSLAWEKPGKESPDHFVFNPKNPVDYSKIGAMARDNRVFERRDDVLVYTSEALEEPLTICGPVSLSLFAATDALNTDWIAKLIDVYPDGRAVNLGPTGFGAIRTRYRNGFDKEVLLTPNTPENCTIKLQDIGHTFLPGHKIRIEITSSAFPFFNPNQNTGNPIATDTEWKIANQTVFHDKARPSRVNLPILQEQKTRN